MLPKTLFLAAMAVGSEAFYLAEHTPNRLERKASTYQGGWPLFTSAKCPVEFPVACGDADVVIQSCCPSGNTCFGGLNAYCCPTGQDCRTQVTTFPVCVDSTANMFRGNFAGYFCCKNGLTGVIPSNNQGLCQDAGQVVPVSLLATMTSQIGGTSVTPFGGFGTATGAPVSGSATGAARTSATNTAAGTKATNSGAATATSVSGAATSDTSTKSGWNPGNGAIAGLAIAAAFILGLIYIIWSQLSKRKARKQALLISDPYARNNPYNGRSSYVHQYMAPPQNSGSGRTAPGYAYDPVLERVEMVSPVSAGARTPLSPAPAYKAVDSHEMSGRVNVAEVPVQSTSARRQGEHDRSG